MIFRPEPNIRDIRIDEYGWVLPAFLEELGMYFRWFAVFLLASFFIGSQALAAESDLRIKALKPGSVVAVDRLLGDDRVLVSVVGADRKPLLGLGANDFTVVQGARAARITAVQPIAESLEVPRNIVLVLDNSDSMRQRHAVAALLAGVDELLKIVRPIDQVQVVVFDNRQTLKIDGRDLHVRIFKSNEPAALKDFVSSVYAGGMTPTTVLYEAMLAGLDLIRAMPADEPKFMVVFSDGEDLNSAFTRAEVDRAALGLARFNGYAIDYMPVPTTDKFLSEFAARNQGSIWKATSETNLVPIFQSVASKMQYYYVVSYLFPLVGSLSSSPVSLVIDELGAAGEVERTIDATALTLRPSIDTAYGVTRWKLTVANERGAIAELAGEGQPARELTVPLPTGKLDSLAAGGNLGVTMDVLDAKGQTLMLSAPVVKVSVVQTTGSLLVAPERVTIEEVRTIDASPMLGHIYFARESSEILPQYVRLSSPEETAGFEEQNFRDTLEKYYQVLNIIGRRLTNHPDATIELVGCNDNVGKERKNKKLSTRRAEAVRDYLQAVWGIAPERMLIEARNLPEMPSTSRITEGQAENRRVEIRSNNPAILAPIRSTYLTNRIDALALTLKPEVAVPHGVARWQVAAANAAGGIGELAGEGAPAAQVTLPLPTGNLPALASGGDLAVTMTLQDRKGQNLVLASAPVKVSFIQTSQRLAEKQGLKVQEKYALILFDFDKDTIDSRNQAIVDTIVARLRDLPQATAEIVGHTDNIGKAGYNVKLSERRALAVYRQLAAAFGENTGERIRHAGVGSDRPLYDNSTPEARSFNRTVTITLEYLSAE